MTDKVYNSKMEYMMDIDVNDSMDRTTKKELKGTKIGSIMSEDDDKDYRYAVFDTKIFDLVTAVQDKYCENEISLDEALDLLTEGFKEFKGKEDKYLKEAKKNYEESEDE
jgi:hypothetical protein